MKLYCLSSDAAKPCFVLSFKELLIMLDCGLSAHSVLSFLPLPPVPSARLAALPSYTPPHRADPALEGELKECCGRVFVDSVPEFCPPLDKVVDFSQLDVILISNYTCMLALPFITEDTGFKGQVLATEPTLQIARFYLEELAARVGYDERVDIYGALDATPVSSGFCLGSANWVLRSAHEKVAYVSGSSTLTTHPRPINQAALKGADLLILAALTQTPAHNPDHMLGDLCVHAAVTLRAGGCVLCPVYPSGVLYDLLECLSAHLDGAGLAHVPLYVVSSRGALRPARVPLRAPGRRGAGARAALRRLLGECERDAHSGVLYDLLECLSAHLDGAGLAHVPLYVVSSVSASEMHIAGCSTTCSSASPRTWTARAGARAALRRLLGECERDAHSGVLYDLLECLSAHLDGAGLAHVPLYVVSEVSASEMHIAGCSTTCSSASPRTWTARGWRTCRSTSSPRGVLYDLLECLSAHLDGAGLAHVPLYVVSEVSASEMHIAGCSTTCSSASPRTWTARGLAHVPLYVVSEVSASEMHIAGCSTTCSSASPRTWTARGWRTCRSTSSPRGVLYDLLECLSAHLDGAGLAHVPLYVVSEVADASLAYSNILAEWVSAGKQARVYLPEEPFPHAALARAGRLKHAKHLHTDSFSQDFRQPCVVFCGHPSLRLGAAVHLLELWGGHPQHAVIFTEPDFPYQEALAPFQPLQIKAFHCPIDTSLNYSQVKP
ncbi:beta-Casp domain-containing protein [Phthorimaea operculella]|nr:beta-Casp domain-containing protein [Phthorimaea operculella]